MGGVTVDVNGPFSKVDSANENSPHGEASYKHVGMSAITFMSIEPMLWMTCGRAPSPRLALKAKGKKVSWMNDVV